jgi:hypothetical protein
MTDANYYTHTRGIRIYLGKPLSTRHLVVLYDQLAFRYVAKYGGVYKFGPDPTSKGGIQMIEWPNMVPGAYKTMETIPSLAGNRWPRIDSDTLDRWRTGESDDIYAPFAEEWCGWSKTGPHISTVLKAFHGAPCWTQEELFIFKECFEILGFAVDHVPEKWLLCDRGELGRAGLPTGQ